MDAVDRILEQWRAERPDINPSPMGVIGRISRAAQFLNTELRGPFAAHGMQRWEFDILATLRRSGAPYRLSAGALVEASMVTSGAITNRIDRLAAKGWVSREVDPDNRRSVRITLTDEGKRIVDDTLADHVANENRILAELTPDEQAQLAALLRKLLISLDDRPAAALRPQGR
ncbi:MarR family winged helix-turn-helix transcriptional regulator [Phytoactinopolyspora halotolerans]|uniref:MarR family winged helix-turn-helix transcriptional regulator n=1 Tax=Phytoactinopolyspora halotolerans TaxID=1981512 RepID=UPI0028B17A8B|nr:MarR family transcriptional regulator [Phytoactinopolyspora halotolerans]